ncbi:P-loop containing nucleoside triphosphate hydrolase protein [Mycena capillaripes]|nr:P-loop containing nucleoside triphosphate hydrolase protein [Mycena capillaripes]
MVPRACSVLLFIHFNTAPRRNRVIKYVQTTNSSSLYCTMYRYIERRNKPRTVPMQVLALGFSRTGTLSMCIALEKLGYNETNHGLTVSTSPLEMEMWVEAINAKFFMKGKPYGRAEWDQLLGHCVAVTDMPHILFAKELISAYPEAKVVLTTRDVDSWWRSFKDTIGGVLAMPVGELTARLVADTAGRDHQFWLLAFNAMFGTTNITEEIAKRRYIEYYDEVRSLVPKERLLEYRVGEGWESLCRFLKKDVPAEPFPKVNDTQSFQDNIKQRVNAVLRRAAVKFVVPAVLVCTCLTGYFIMV